MDVKELTTTFVKKYRWSEESVKIALRARFKCEYCGRNFLDSVDDYDSWQIDHVFPASKGGPDSHDNYAASCKTCNFLKKDWVPPGNLKLDRDTGIEAAIQYITDKRFQKDREISEMRELVEKLL